MEEKNRHILENALKELPQFKAPERIWDKVEEELEKEEREKNCDSLKQAIAGLPLYKAKDNWDVIEKDIKGKPGNFSIYYLRIAASVTVLFGLGIAIYFSMKNTNNAKTQITFSTEVVQEETFDIPPLGFEEELNDLIAMHCEAQPVICKKPEFLELTEELSDLSESLQMLEEAYGSSGNDPEKYKYLLRIQKEKAEVSRKLIQYLNS